MKKTKTLSRNNPVAKHSSKFNRPSTHVDRKKESKKRGQFSKDDLYPNNGF